MHRLTDADERFPAARPRSIEVPEHTAHDWVAPPTSQGVLRLQSRAGNRAVTGLLNPVAQRQPTAGAAGPDGSAQDSELEAVLAQIDATLPSAPRVPAFEAITGTTAGEYSTGELEEDISRLWSRQRLDFTEAARRTVARGDDRRGPRGTQSPNLRPQTAYALRWSVNLFAANYPRSRSDLPDVARIARPGSPFSRSLAAEFSRTFPVTDPTGHEIESEIIGAVVEMFTALEPGASGEIVVTYSGHGGNGVITGVDWADVGPERLRSLAHFAADHNVHLIFVLDTCRAGTLAAFAASAALNDAEGRIGNLPADQRSAARARVAFTRRLGRALFALNGAVIAAGDAARTVRRAATDANRVAAFERFNAVFHANRELGVLLREPNRGPGLPSMTELLSAHEALGWGVLSALTAERSSMTSALRSSAVVLDLGQDVANSIIAQLDAETRSAGSRDDGGGRAGDAGAGRP